MDTKRECVNIRPEPMSCEFFKKAFYDRMPKQRIPELLNCLSDEDRQAFETYLKAEADKKGD
ncbi:MAG: hypothetical protein OXN25_01515 [Candidatus Poribacteria bacterium]|nr:hypothetical protein [Candidatus Poribacteria bacterium]